MKYKFEHCIGARFRRLTRVIDGNFRASLKEFDITEHQMTLLFALKNLGKIDQGELGRRHAMERSSVSRGINVLYKNGYVHKSGDYRPQISLSQKGEDLVRQLVPLWEKLMDKLISDIGEDGMEMILKLEQKII